MLESDQNPLLQPWSGEFDTPPFAAIKSEHYRPAFDVAIAEHKAEVNAIADAKTISTEVDGTGRLILSSPSVNNAAVISKAGKIASVSIDKHDHKKRTRNIRSA